MDKLLLVAHMSGVVELPIRIVILLSKSGAGTPGRLKAFIATARLANQFAMVGEAQTQDIEYCTIRA